MIRPFHDRIDAGRRLANELRDYEDRPEVIVLALPRGGVPVGFEVARALHAPLDVFVVRKLGVPGHEELAMGAIADGRRCACSNDDVVRRAAACPRPTIERGDARASSAELERRERLYRGDRPPPECAGGR